MLNNGLPSMINTSITNCFKVYHNLDIKQAYNPIHLIIGLIPDNIGEKYGQ